MSETTTGSAATSSTAATPPQPWSERIRSVAAVLAAIAGALTGLWGIYEKVRSEARKDTAASYNTLAPQVNQLGEALKRIQEENQQLREIVAQNSGRPRLATVPPSRAKPGHNGARSERPVAPAQPGAPVGASAPVAVDRAPIETPPATPPAAVQAEPVTEKDPEDRISGLLRTVGETRAAIESLKKVPDDFGRVLEKKPEEDKKEAPP